LHQLTHSYYLLRLNHSKIRLIHLYQVTVPRSAKIKYWEAKEPKYHQA